VSRRRASASNSCAALVTPAIVLRGGPPNKRLERTGAQPARHSRARWAPAAQRLVELPTNKHPLCASRLIDFPFCPNVSVTALSCGRTLSCSNSS
jgi:hypothetical protein